MTLEQELKIYDDFVTSHLDVEPKIRLRISSEMELDIMLRYNIKSYDVFENILEDYRGDS